MAEDPSQDGIEPFLVQHAVRIRGPLDVPRLRQALHLVGERHELLRTSFHRVDGKVYQRTDPGARLELHHVRVGGQRTRAMNEVANQSFDRSTAPLARCSLFEFAPGNHALVIAMDHMITDGVSLDVFMTDLGTAYRELATRPDFRLPPLEFQFADWAEVQRRRCAGPQLDEVLAHWRDRLGPDPEIVTTPFTAYRPPQLWRSAGTSVTLSGPDADLVRDGARRCRVTLFAYLLGAFLLSLREPTGRTRLCAVTTLANREPGTAELFGPLAHDAYLLVDVSDDPGLDTAARRAQQATAEATRYGMLPNTDLCERLWPDAGLEEIFSAPSFYFSLNRPWADGMDVGGAPVEALRTEQLMPMPGLECVAVDRGGDLEIGLRYLAGSFPRDYPEQLAAEVVERLRAAGTHR
jgi:hypothetical protein